jgi:hypothetical protein
MFKKPVIEAAGINIRVKVVKGGLRRRKRRSELLSESARSESPAIHFAHGLVFFLVSSPQDRVCEDSNGRRWAHLRASHELSSSGDKDRDQY